MSRRLLEDDRHAAGVGESTENRGAGVVRVRLNELQVANSVCYAYPEPNYLVHSRLRQTVQPRIGEFFSGPPRPGMN